MYFKFLQFILGFSVEFNRKPSIIFLKFIQKLKKRSFLEHFVTILIFDMSQLLEEVKVFYFSITQNISQYISDVGFNFQKRFESDSINILKTFAVEMRKIFNLKFPEES